MQLSQIVLGSSLLLAFSACAGGGDEAPGASGGAAGATLTPGDSAVGGAAGSAMEAAAGSSGSAALAGASGASGAAVDVMNGGAGVTAGGAGGAAGSSGAAGSGGAQVVLIDAVPADYEGEPFKTAQKIPGTVYASDYDRGGAGVAYCHGDEEACTAGIYTMDWFPADTPPYRTPVPEDAEICGGGACDDNVGVCRGNPEKPDHLYTGELVMPLDPYVCWTEVGQWLKYTVEVTEPGTFKIGGFMAAPTGAMLRLDFEGEISTGSFAVPESPTEQCQCSEVYHSWMHHEELAEVTFEEAGTYLMTLHYETTIMNVSTLVFSKQ